jgi:hypothetical protein
MIIMHYGTHDGVEGLMLVLEPGNIEKLKLGQPVIKRMSKLDPQAAHDFEVAIAFTPDSIWVSEQIRGGKGIAEALEESITRPEVFLRPSQAEQVVRAEDARAPKKGGDSYYGFLE